MTKKHMLKLYVQNLLQTKNDLNQIKFEKIIASKFLQLSFATRKKDNSAKQCLQK